MRRQPHANAPGTQRVSPAPSSRIHAGLVLAPCRRIAASILVILVALMVVRVAAQSGPVTYLYDALGRLVGVVDGTGASAIYTYDAVGNLLSIQRQGPGAVAIIAFTPTSGAPGATVIVSGTGFSPIPAQNVLTFQGTAATVAASTATQLTVTVPVGATSGPLAVSTPSGSAVSAQAFTITSGGPTITGFTPTAGTAGTSVTMTGQNFDPLITNDRTSLNGLSAAVTAASPTALSATVPPGATSGRLTVMTPSGTAISGSDFFVPPPSYMPLASVRVAGSPLEHRRP